MSGDHFYTLDFRGELAPGIYEREGITGYVYRSQQPGTTPIFRWYNSRNGDHFYTADPDGELAPPAYRSEGIGWYMFKDRVEDSVPLYRWYNHNSGDHFYTTDPNGELAPQAGYRSEGITGYLHPTAVPKSVPVYRWYASGLLRNFTFDGGITAVQRSTLLERHTWAHYCARHIYNLPTQAKEVAGRIYWKPINHRILSDPGGTVTSSLNSISISINFVNLFSLNDELIALLLLQHMLRCAGYPIDILSLNPDVLRDGSDSVERNLTLAPLMNITQRATPATCDHDRAQSKL